MLAVRLIQMLNSDIDLQICRNFFVSCFVSCLSASICGQVSSLSTCPEIHPNLFYIMVSFLVTSVPRNTIQGFASQSPICLYV